MSNAVWSTANMRDELGWAVIHRWHHESDGSEESLAAFIHHYVSGLEQRVIKLEGDIKRATTLAPRPLAERLRPYG